MKKKDLKSNMEKERRRDSELRDDKEKSENMNAEKSDMDGNIERHN